MSGTPPPVRVGVYGQDYSRPGERHGCKLWPAGVEASVTAAEATPVSLNGLRGRAWDDVLETLHGVVVAGHDGDARRHDADAEELCEWAHARRLPLLAVDHGLHALNTSHGGTVHYDLPRDLPEALQHRHPPERGQRHAINVLTGTGLAALYGEGEVVVNSEHRRGLQKVARGFRVCATALDGVVEAIESEDEWFALGVQWQPATATASGLDIQLFRGLVRACQARLVEDAVACEAA
jgi:gamma-glutamyl-gamma-aminobutyrate hydrolase PuuD